MRSPGIASSLSSVPPVCPSPRPDSFATASPSAAPSGANASVTPSATPPVECLSTFGREIPSSASVSPEADHRAGERQGLFVVEPVDAGRHEPRRGLIVGEFAPGIVEHEGSELIGIQPVPVALGGDEVPRVGAARAPARPHRPSSDMKLVP